MIKASKNKKISLGEQLFPTFISSVPHHKKTFGRAIVLTALITVFSFLLLNIIVSQLISPAYFELVNDDQQAALYYLRSIRQHANYSSELTRLTAMYGDSFKDLVLAEEANQIAMFQKLEQILGKNPYARDILFDLFLLYDRIGNKNLAQQFLMKAKAVDPAIK